MDDDDLYETLKINRDKPAIIFANIGTTMTEAKDDLKKIKHILDKAVFDENILVRIDDKPGALGRVSRTLSENDIDIRGITMMEQNEDFNIVAIVTNKDDKARQILNQTLVK